MKSSKEEIVDEINIRERHFMGKSSYEHFPRKCFVASVCDYREFKSIQNHFKLAELKYKFEEVGCDGKYYAVFWLGKKPVRYIKLLKNYMLNKLLKRKYSGLKDSNGNKLYSGDRVSYYFNKYDKWQIGVIVFEDGCFRAVFHFIAHDDEKSSLKTSLLKYINTLCQKIL